VRRALGAELPDVRHGMSLEELEALHPGRVLVQQVAQVRGWAARRANGEEHRGRLTGDGQNGSRELSYGPGCGRKCAILRNGAG